jgi:hypothetical protein
MGITKKKILQRGKNMKLKITSTILSLIFFTYPAYAGTNFSVLSKSTTYIQLDKIEEQRKKAKKLSEQTLSPERLKEIKEHADAVLKSSSALVKRVVTQDRVRLMLLMRNNRLFIESMAKTMRLEFSDRSLTQYEDNVRYILRYTEKQARDGKSLKRALNILSEISDRASSPLGSSFHCYSKAIKD